MSHTATASTILEIITLQRKTLSKNGKAVVYQLPGAQGILYTTLFTSQAAAPATVDIRVPAGSFKVADAGKAEKAAQREAKRTARLANAEARLQKMLARAAKLQADLDKRKADNPAQPAITVAPVVRRTIDAFLRSFDGSPDVGRLKVVSPNRPAWMRKPAKPLDEEELEEIHAELTLILEQQPEGTLELPSLRFGWKHGVLRISGNRRDLMLFCAMHLLLTQGFASELGRCEAPRPYHYDHPERCGKWFPRETRGRPRRWCGNACKQRFKEARQSGRVKD